MKVARVYIGQNAMTVHEVQELLSQYPVGSHYRLIWILMATLGLRPGEVVGQRKSRIARLSPANGLTLEMFKDNFHHLEYPVLKPRITRRDRDGRVTDSVMIEKIRRVRLPDWTREELLQYLERRFRFDALRGKWIGIHPGAGLFPIHDTAVLDAEFAELRQRLGGSWLEKEREYANNSRMRHLYRCRPHKLRHFWVTVRYYQLGKDLVAVQREIGHSKVETSFGYSHSATELGSTAAELAEKPWHELLQAPKERPLWTYALHGIEGLEPALRIQAET